MFGLGFLHRRRQGRMMACKVINVCCMCIFIAMYLFNLIAEGFMEGIWIHWRKLASKRTRWIFWFSYLDIPTSINPSNVLPTLLMYLVSYCANDLDNRPINNAEHFNRMKGVNVRMYVRKIWWHHHSPANLTINPYCLAQIKYTIGSFGLTTCYGLYIYVMLTITYSHQPCILCGRERITLNVNLPQAIHCLKSANQQVWL